MKRLPVRSLASLLPAAFFWASLARAQDIPSHEIDPDLTPAKNISKLLDPKRVKGKGGNVDVEMMQNLLKFMQGKVDPNDVDPEMVKEFLRDNPEFKDPKNLDKLRDLADKQMREPRNPNDRNPPVDWGGVKDQLKKIDDLRPKQPVNPNDPMDPLVRPPFDKQDPPRPLPVTPPAKTNQDKESQNFAKWVAKNFGNNPEMKNMAKDFAKIMGGDGKNNGGFLKDVEKEWKSITGSGNKSGGGDSNLKDIVNKMKLPDTGSNSGGSGRSATSNNDSSGGDSGSSQTSSSSGGGWSFGGTGGGSWTPVVVLALAAVGGFLVYIYYVRHKKPEEEAPAESARVWPVDPMQVHTREDVVKAFEFLSVSKCGDEAVNWHHLQIADRMGNREPVHKEASNRLARLYEKARYAPANELFDDMDIAEARARFSQMAGASIA